MVELTGYKILLVEDDADLRSSLRHMLESAGANVFEAVGANPALVFLETNTVDLVLSDIGMPNGDGYLLLNEVQGRWPKLPTVFMSGNPFSREKMAQRGVSYVLEKPFLKKTLLKTLKDRLVSF